MEKFKYLVKDKISKVPKTPGVYAFRDGKEFLYIGKAVNLKERVKQHRKLLSLAKQIGYIGTASEEEALILEAKSIKKYRPKYNTAWKDDKNYFYVGITQEEFPRVFITHQMMLGEDCPLQSRLVERTVLSKPEYIGPFTNGKALKQTLKDIRKIYPYRTCKTIPKKPCLWYHLEQCPAPCLPRRQAGLFRGQRLEAYDISNIQGQQATGSMVTFINGKPDKNFYRRFKIKTIKQPNDVAMIKEVLTRRLNHPEWPYPDLILIDGGKAQLNAAKLTIQQFNNLTIPVMALAKKENKLYLEGRKKPVWLKNLPEDFANLILRARDEAHRFALAYHHYLRDKSLIN